MTLYNAFGWLELVGCGYNRQHDKIERMWLSCLGLHTDGRLLTID